MQDEIICQLCEKQYTDQNPPRLLITCGHTFCEDCLKNMITEKKGGFKIICPEDGQLTSMKQNNVENFPKNLALLKVINAKNNSLELQMSKIPNHDLTPEDEETRDIVDAIRSSEQKSSPLKKQQEQRQQQLCPHHHKSLDIVCIIDMQRICASCAIFGKHKGHEFKSLEQIENERLNYCNSILNIMDKKEVISSQISSGETCQSIMQILEKKKQKMKRQINDKYRKLIEAIQLKQRESIKSLDHIISKTEGKLKNLMKIDEQSLEKYDRWEDKSYQQIKILEGDDFNEKLQLLFADDDAGDVLDEGDKIVDEMKKQEDNLFVQVETALDNIGVEFDTEIHNHTDFVQIYDDLRKKKNKAKVGKPATKIIKRENIESLNKSKQEQKQGKNLLSIPIPKKIAKNEQQPTSLGNSLTNEESLLDMDMEEIPDTKSELKQITSQIKVQQSQVSKAHDLTQEFIPIESIEPLVLKQKKLPYQSSPKTDKSNISNSSEVKKERTINKKKLSKIQIPQRYEKVLESLIHDTAETIDFTNAQLGENNVVLISELIRGSKAKTIKFIRNKLEDEAIHKILPYMGSVITLNLSQNFLTQHTLDMLIEARNLLPKIKNIILSQNRIIQRKHKLKIQKLRKTNVTVSV